MTDFKASLAFCCTLSLSGTEAESVTVLAASVAASVGASEVLCSLCSGWKRSFKLSRKPLRPLAGASGVGSSGSASVTDFKASEALSLMLSLSGTAVESMTVLAASLAASAGASEVLCSLCSGWNRSFRLSRKPPRRLTGSSGVGAASVSGTMSGPEPLFAASVTASAGISDVSCSLCSGCEPSFNLSTALVKLLTAFSGAGNSGADSPADFTASDAPSTRLELSGADSVTLLAASLAVSVGFWVSLGRTLSFKLSKKLKKPVDGASGEEEPGWEQMHLRIM